MDLKNPANEKEIIEKFLRACLINSKFTDKKINDIFSNFDDLSFTSFKGFNFVIELSSVNGNKFRLKKGKGKQLARIRQIQSDIIIEEDLRATIIKFFTKRFVHKQFENISKKKLVDLNFNPFIIRMFNFKTPEEVLAFQVGALFYRSITTSLGSELEKLSLFGHYGVEKLKTGFDGVKLGKRKPCKTLVQLKAGIWDVDKTQMEKYNTEFNKAEEEKGVKTILGFLYGNSKKKGVSLGMAKLYLDNWKKRVMVGKELWDFISGEPNYHKKVLRWIQEAAGSPNSEIMQEIEKLQKRLLPKFIKKYGRGKAGVEKCVAQSM